jgi:hypothetical protein
MPFMVHAVDWQDITVWAHRSSMLLRAIFPSYPDISVKSTMADIVFLLDDRVPVELCYCGKPPGII